MENEVFNLPPLKVCEYRGKKVLSNKQIAAYLQCTGQAIKDVFRHHSADFIEDVDYFFLTKGELRDFKIQNGLLDLQGSLNLPCTQERIEPPCDLLFPFSKTANSGYLWTKSGVIKIATYTRSKKAKFIYKNFLSVYFGNDTVEGIGDTCRVLPHLADLNCVYAMELDDGTVKIGRSANIDERSRQIENETGCKVLRIYHTELLPKTTAVKIESDSCKALNPYLAHGKEYFCVAFDAARAVIEQSAETIHPPKNDFTPREKLDTLKFLIANCTDENLRDELIKTAANILINLEKKKCLC